MAASKMEVLRLYKLLLRETSGFSNYIYRTYSLRRVKDSFKEHKNESDPSEIATQMAFGRQNLEMVKRQVILGQLYKSPELVIEKENSTKQLS